MEPYTTLDLTDRQFLKVRNNGYAIVFLVHEIKRYTGRPRRTLRRETRIEIFEKMLSSFHWRNQLICAHVSNVIIDARRKWSGNL